MGLSHLACKRGHKVAVVVFFSAVAKSASDFAVDGEEHDFRGDVDAAAHRVADRERREAANDVPTVPHTTCHGVPKIVRVFLFCLCF